MFLDLDVKFIFTLFIIEINNEEISKQSISSDLPQRKFTTSNNFRNNLETSNTKQETNTNLQKQGCHKFFNVSNDVCLGRVGQSNIILILNLMGKCNRKYN